MAMDKKEHRKALRQAFRESIGRIIADIDAPYARDADTYLAFYVKLNELQENYIKDKGIDIDNYTGETYDELLSDILRANPEMIQEATDWAIDAVKKKDEIPLDASTKSGILIAATTKYPDTFITPTDKISNSIFTGEINSTTKLAMERRGSRKELTTAVSIDFDELDNKKITIQGSKELTPYDREVYNAIVTLYVEGKNEYITPQMIYQVMTGDSNARLKNNQHTAISDSITKFMHGNVEINADDEAKVYGFDTFKYDGNLIIAERIRASLNGNDVECVRLFRTPILYEYANMKNQIGRFDIKLLNTPINKNEETVALQGYLYRRILAMKGSNLSRNILYDTIYRELSITAPNNDALRKKKLDVRGKIKKILDYWKQKGFISGYSENSKAKEKHSITINIK